MPRARSPSSNSSAGDSNIVGPVGSGAVMKLTINMPLMIYWQALGEALALCRPLGLDPARIMDLLADTSGGPNVLKVRGAGVAECSRVATAAQ